ncbi:MAG: hypothetical protein Q9167_006898 [Letrouitia subvulpina]
MKHLPSIRWAFYRQNALDAEHSSSHNRFAAGNDEDLDFGRTLQKTECLLRQLGHHVFYDHFQISLWIFDFLDEGVRDPHSAPQHDDVSRVMNSVGISSPLLGLIEDPTTAADVAYHSSLPVPVQMPSNVPDIHKGTPSENSLELMAKSHPEAANDAILDNSEKHIRKVLQPDFSQNSAVQNFLSAVSLSLIYSLTKGGDWIPLGRSSCIRNPNITNSAEEESEVTQQTQNGLEFLSLENRWSSPGAMTVSSQSTLVSWMYSVEQDAASAKSQESRPAKDKIPVIISPFGTVGNLLDSRSQTKRDQTKDGDNLSSPDVSDKARRMQALSWLSEYGIAVPKPIHWCRLRMLEQDSGNAAVDFEDQSLELLWPAYLCFGVREIQKKDDDSVLEQITQGIYIDPISRAKQWFSSQPDLERAIEAQRKAEQQKGSTDLDSDKEEDGFSEPSARNNQYLTAQEASGIYPTPPDGILFHTQSSTSGQDSHRASGDAFNDNKGEQKDSILPDVRSLEPSQDHLNIAANRVENDVGQDLFGGIDMEMFAANDLTEADFDFFDEPNFSTGSIKGGHIGNLDDDHRRAHSEISSIASDEIENKMQVDTAVAEGPRSNQAEVEGPQNFEFQNNSPKYSPADECPTKSFIDQRICPVNEGANVQDEGSLITSNNEANDTRSSFDSISFRHHLKQELDRKYNANGQFAYDFDPVSLKTRSNQVEAQTLKLPSIGPLGRGTAPTDSSSECSENMSLDEEDLSSTSDTPEPAYLDDSDTFGFFPDEVSRKHKRKRSNDSQYLATPAASVTSPTFSQGPSTARSCFISPETIIYQTVNGLNELPSSPFLSSKRCMQLSMSSKSFVQLAQVIADQMVLRSSFVDEIPGVTPLEWQLSTCRNYSLDNLLKNALQNQFPQSESCNLKNFRDINSAAMTNSRALNSAAFDSNQKNKGQKAQQDLLTCVATLPSPLVRIRRGENLMEIATPALRFWEELGLAPVSGSKNVTAFCIYPDQDAMRRSVSTFLDTLGTSYQSCKLGLHVRGSGLQHFQQGLVPVTIKDSSPSQILHSINSVCEALAFLKLFETYASPLRQPHTYDLNDLDDLALQIVPIDFLVSTRTLVIPSLSAYAKLALEVYSRCSPTAKNLDDSLYASASAIQLARTVPRSIDFKLKTESPGGLLRSDRCIHLAYSWKEDEPWFTVAWTSNIGDIQWHASYGFEFESWQSFLDIAKEIWRTTLQIVFPKNGIWRVFIVKDGPMYELELDILLSLAFSSQSSFTTATTFLTINTSPPLRFPLPPPPIPPFPSMNTSQQTESPPVSTPHDPLLTPDYPSPLAGRPTPTNTATPNAPPTPSTAGFEEDTRLIDIREDCWSFVVPAPISDILISNILYAAPKLGTGYLLKRIYDEDDANQEKDVLGVVGVELMFMEALSSARQEGNGGRGVEGRSEERFVERAKILGDVMGMYRNLATLAKMRNLDDGVGNKVPWHVLAVRRARKGLRILRWGGEPLRD